MTRWIVETQEPNKVELVFHSLEEAEEFCNRCANRVFTIKKYQQVKNGNFSDE